VIRALEGVTAPMDCVPQPAACQLSPGCAIRDIWNQIDVYATELLSATTLEQLAARHRVPAQDRDAMYYI